MNVHLTSDPKLAKTDHLFVLLAEDPKKLDLPKPLAGTMKKIIDDAGFAGRAEESITVLGDEPRKVTLVGLGKKDKISIRGMRAAIYAAGKIARKQRDERIAIAFPGVIPGLDAEQTVKIAGDAMSQADYRYDDFKTVRKDGNGSIRSATLIVSDSLDSKRVKELEREIRILADAVRAVRDLGNTPSNVLTPTRLGERAEEIAKEAGIKATVYGKREIERMKMGGLLAVNSGSSEEPRFIVLEYSPRRAKKHVALVGKGITFDSGGISIKPAEKMEEMKFDMCGAAAVIGTMQAAARLDIAVKITGVIPTTENLPSGSAFKPGDIVTTMSGKTIEVVNTDAEGRVILSDALHFASEKKPDHIIDFATLTGACIIALGNEAAGLFSNDDELAQKLIESGERVGERLWRMPEWDDYKELIRSEWADVKNSGGRAAGSITAAIFLKEFVDCPSWAHLDIAGTAHFDRETSREARGATGAGVRVTLEFLQSLAQS